MTGKTTLAIAGFALAVVGAFASGSAARAQGTMSLGCASGYHPDALGDCQPNGQTIYDGPCQPGFRYQVFPNGNGYRCRPDGY